MESFLSLLWNGIISESYEMEWFLNLLWNGMISESVWNGIISESLWNWKAAYRYKMSHDMIKTTKWMCAQRRLGSAWAPAQSDQSSLSTWRKLGPWATHWVQSEDSDQIGHSLRLIIVFAGRTVILLVLSWGGSNVKFWLFRAVVLIFILWYRSCIT